MGKNAIFIALLIVFDGAAVAWAAYEVWKIRPDKTNSPEIASALSRVSPNAASPESTGHPEGEHGADER